MSTPSKGAFVFASFEVARMVKEGKTLKQMNNYAFSAANDGEKRDALIHAVANYIGYEQGYEEGKAFAERLKQ